MEYRESIGRLSARKQSSAGPPEVKMVSVAVLPPRLPPGMAPPSGVGAAGVFGWEESLNWQHNEKIESAELKARKKSIFKKAGLTGERTKKNPDLPPFTFRSVPYDTWRKHYAKDKDGNYKGTHAPAEDCLLKPDDVAKWRLEAPRTKGDQWTRGSEVLPVYAEAQAEGQAPHYDIDFDDLSYDHPPPGEPTVEEEASMRTTSNASESAMRTTSNASTNTQDANVPRAKVIADGKTAQEIIEEARKKEQPKGKKGFKNMMKRGAEYAMMGTNI